MQMLIKQHQKQRSNNDVMVRADVLELRKRCGPVAGVKRREHLIVAQIVGMAPFRHAVVVPTDAHFQPFVEPVEIVQNIDRLKFRVLFDPFLMAGSKGPIVQDAIDSADISCIYMTLKLMFELE